MKTVELGLAAIGLGVLSACGSSSSSAKRGAMLSPADFVSPVGAAQAVAVPPDVLLRPVSASDRRGPLDAADGILDVTAAAGSPVIDSPRPSTSVATSGASPRVDEWMLVDAKVGDVNGRPVYANAFLANKADRLRAEAKLMRYPEWKVSAMKSITEDLNQLVEKELLRAEALASLTPEQKQGFIAWMQGLQERVKSQNLGSREMANQRMLETEGKGLDEYMKDRQLNELAAFQLAERIEKRVSVSKRDVQVEYQRMFDYFNPPPKASYRIIQVPNSAPADADEVVRLLASGTPFADIAAMPLNRYKPDSGGLEVREYKGDRASATLFANESLNRAAQTMAVGGIAGPIELSASRAWISLEGIEALSVSLYDAQLPIERMIQQRRTKSGKDKYIAELKARASMTSVEDMAAALFAIAEARYYPDRNYQPPARPRR